MTEHGCTWDFGANEATLSGQTFKLCSRPRNSCRTRTLAAAGSRVNGIAPSDCDAEQPGQPDPADLPACDVATAVDESSSSLISPPTPRLKRKSPVENNDDCELHDGRDVQVESRLRPAEKRRAPARHQDFVRH